MQPVIYLHRQGEVTGPFSKDQIAHMWGTGQLTADCLWREGEGGGWQTFSDLEERLTFKRPALVVPTVAAAPVKPTVPATPRPVKASCVKRTNPTGGGCAIQGVGLVSILIALATFMTGIGPIIFGPLGIWLLVYGNSKASWFECTRCGAKLANGLVRVCPQCGGEF